MIEVSILKITNSKKDGKTYHTVMKKPTHTHKTYITFISDKAPDSVEPLFLPPKTSYFSSSCTYT